MGDGEPRRSKHASEGGGHGAPAPGSGGASKTRKSKQSSSKKQPTAEDLLRSGRDILSRMDGSPFFAAHPARTFPDFERTELGFGKKLGSGAFCDVSEILAMRLAKKAASDEEEDVAAGDGGGDVDCAATAPSTGHSRVSTEFPDEGEGDGDGGGDGDGAGDGAATEPSGAANDPDPDGGGDDEDEFERHYDMVPSVAREYMRDQCLRDGDARYAVKRLRLDLSEFEKAKGIVDLAVEAKFLSSIHHPNIVKMRGTASADPLGPDNFIVMDRLYDTLEERIGQWAARRKMGAGCMGCIGGNKEEMEMLLVERLTAAYDIASVFRYLHGNKLVYRDIKPDNMGFDVRGDIKVFDFGLCKELTANIKTKDGLYDLTGLTGSRRYMAPEVVLCKPYNQTCDVFSYGILLWEILALEIPFETFDPRDHTEKVVRGGYRPALSSSWPVMTRGLLKDCWSADISERPDFVRIASILKGELTQLAADAVAGGSIAERTKHMMRRSQHSFRLHSRGSVNMVGAP